MAEEPAPAEAPAAEAPAPAAPAAPPQLTKAQAAEILDKVIEEAKNEELVKEVKAILEDVKKTHPDDPMAQQMQKVDSREPSAPCPRPAQRRHEGQREQQMQRLMPLAMQKFGPVIKSYGFDESTLMVGMMQIQMMSMVGLFGVFSC
ncbi:unnamed protein product [Prorocentrum cordatum]|uniref:Protein C10 n=1 Tax=Prorocentrum cordatum TaxID=2364126 RepID=A0ABN9WJR9_9DINO|nr:unnamed protein product [Polarella glacialis]